MKKYGLNNGYIGIDQLKTIGGMISQHKHASLRQGNQIRLGGATVIQDGLRSEYDITDINTTYPSAWTDRGPQSQNLEFLGSPELVVQSGIDYLDFDATTDGFRPINSYSLTGNSPGTIGMVIRTTDTQALFFGTGNYLGAYRSGNKFYNSGFGSPTYWQDGYNKANIYDFLIDGNWHYIEFKNVDRAATTNWTFSRYGGYELNCDLRAVVSYDRNLSSEETLANYNFYNNSGYLTT